MNKNETRRLIYSTLDQVINEIDVHFSYQNTKLYAAVSAFQPKSSNFLEVKMVQLLLDLVDHSALFLPKSLAMYIFSLLPACNYDLHLLSIETAHNFTIFICLFHHLQGSINV